MNRSNPLLIVLALGAMLLIVLNLTGQFHVQLPGGTLDITGRARVVDGDTLDMGGRRIRLFGIDAPESAQSCERDGAAYACGQAAKHYLEALVAGQPVNCHARDKDKYGRTVATCTVGEADINAAMVRAGWAVAYRQYSKAYVPLEEEARSRRAGIWAGTFEPPSNWRREQHGG